MCGKLGGAQPEPFRARARWAQAQAPGSPPGPTANQHPVRSSCLGPREPLPLCRGHWGQRPGGSGGKAGAGCEQAPADADLMTQDLMTWSLWGGASLGGGGGRSSHQLSASGFTAKAGAAAPQSPGLSLQLGEAEVAGPPGLQSSGLNWWLGFPRQLPHDLSLLICQVGQRSTSEGSCAAWQEPTASGQ